MHPRNILFVYCALSSLLLQSAIARAEEKPGVEATITVRVPADAELFFDGMPTKSKGVERVFATPPLDAARTFHYDVLARWQEQGKTVERSKRVEIQAGAKIELSFIDSASSKSDRPLAARSASEAGVLLHREAEGKPWQPVPANGALPSGDMILAIDLDAALISKNGGVRLAFRGDFNGNSPFPVLETAVVLHQAADVDLDVTLDRGRIDLVNTKDKGPARVRLHVQDKVGEFILPEPGARVAVEIYGRWPRGVPFTKDLKPGGGPALAIVVLAVKGEIGLKGKEKELTLKAPPGPALIQGDGLNDLDPTPVFLEKLPDWAVDGVDTERGQRLRVLLGHFRQQVLAKGVDAAIDELAQSEDERVRRGAVVLMGALDDLARLGTELLNGKHPDVWDATVLAMRHWIGRAPGQDQKLYRGLIEKRGYKPAEAASVLQLLHSFDDDELAHPELYEVLINYLGNDKFALRGLAHWHLIRLVPAGKKIAYDPHAAKEQRDRAIQEWRKLIPSGKLPPADDGTKDKS